MEYFFFDHLNIFVLIGNWNNLCIYCKLLSRLKKFAAGTETECRIFFFNPNREASQQKEQNNNNKQEK